MLTLLMALVSANAAVPTPTVDGDQVVSCAGGASVPTLQQVARPGGRAGATLGYLASKDLVDLTQPFWATSSKRSNALNAVSFTMAAGVDPAGVANALPDDGVYTVQGQVIVFTWTGVPSPAASAVDVMKSFEATNGCVVSMAGDADQAGGFWVHEGRLRVEGRFPPKAMEEMVNRIGTPMTGHAKASTPMDASTTEPIALAMRVNMDLGTKQLNPWLALAKIPMTVELDLPMEPGAQVGLVGSPRDPGLVASLRLPSKKSAKALYNALIDGAVDPAGPMLLAAVDGKQVFFATSPTLLADVRDPATGTAWFEPGGAAPTRVESDPGVFVRLRNGHENANLALVPHRDGHLLMVAEGPNAVGMMRWP